MLSLCKLTTVNRKVSPRDVAVTTVAVSCSSPLATVETFSYYSRPGEVKQKLQRVLTVLKAIDREFEFYDFFHF